VTSRPLGQLAVRDKERPLEQYELEADGGERDDVGRHRRDPQ